MVPFIKYILFLRLLCTGTQLYLLSSSCPVTILSMDLTGSCQSLPGACLKNHFRVLCSPHCAPQGISCPSGNIRVQIAGMIFKTRSGLPAAVFVISSKNFSYFNITHSITSIPRIILNLLYSWSPEKLRYNIYGSARYSAWGSLPPTVFLIPAQDVPPRGFTI